MKEIIFPILIVAVTGLLAGAVLAVLSKIMAVPVDEKEEKILEVLPGANCGACGFSGCSGYAGALSDGKCTQTNLCAPGGNDVSEKIAEITGLSSTGIRPMTAVVLCQGHNTQANKKMIYSGVDSCVMASQLFGGDKSCIYGCIGLGDCKKECPYEAINICNGVAIVSPDLCKACKKCISACPKGVIELIPKDEIKASVLCKNHDKGALTVRECSAGCIGCGKCRRVCNENAISIENFCAVIDYEKCTGCGQCTEVCPNSTIRLLNRIRGGK